MEDALLNDVNNEENDEDDEDEEAADMEAFEESGMLENDEVCTMLHCLNCVY